ncbi:MAG: hypothetical protein V4481_05310 [Patescibacteria group bacterium]
MQVPSTPTQSDKFMESKKLADGNALKIQHKEKLECEIKDLQITKDELVKRTGYTPAEYKKIEDDHFKKMRALEEGTIKARIELERINNSISDVKTELARLEARTTVLRQEKEVMESDIKIMTSRKSELESSTIEASKNYDRLISEKSRDLAILDEKVGKKKNANALISKEMDERMATVIEQERLMAIRREDLEIYEARLRAKYPNDPIIL